MKCPYCENDMEKGEVQIGDIIDARLKTGDLFCGFLRMTAKNFYRKKRLD